jgi:hypothetical protein
MESAHAAKVMRFLQDAYFIAVQFRRRPGDFERLQAHKFWKQWRQKPKDRKTSKWVLYFILQATTTNDRNRARKYAAILDGLMQDEVEISEVAERIKALGGVEAAYKAICARKCGAAVNATDESGDDQSVRSENTRSPTANVVSAHKKKRPFSRKGLRRIFTLSGPLWVRR